jgi:hypothetical protein
MSESTTNCSPTLESYLRAAAERNVIDFRIRCTPGADGTTGFYIHPDGKDGDTLDFTVTDNELKLRNCACATPQPPLVESPVADPTRPPAPPAAETPGA